MAGKQRRARSPDRSSGAARQPSPRRAATYAASLDDSSREVLLARYRGLRAKYQELVRRYEAQVTERSGAVALALTAMRTSTTGLALFVEGRVVAQNPPFAKLNHVQGEWRRVGDTGAKPRAGLRDLSRAEARALLDRGAESEAVARYEHHPSGMIIEVHAERGGQDEAIAVIVHDVTERCRTDRELQAAREAVFEHQRMRAVGELASGIAHDLNNSLHAMSMRLTALRHMEGARSDVAPHLDSLARIVTDAAVRVGRLQEFARQRQDAPHESVDLAAIVRDAVALGRPEVEATSRRKGRQISIETSLEDLPAVSGVAAELRHVFVNLLLNARDAMSAGGTIEIAGRVEDGHVLVTVADQGPGISPENLSRVFEPFFTTKAEKATGLGLAVAHGVMRRLGGSISAATAETGGAVFTLRFPIAPREQGRAETDVSPVSVKAAAGRRVLVVDDEEDNLDAMRFLLEDLGQTVTTAHSGSDAVALFRAGGRYDLVLCDLGMPGLNGWQTAREIRAMAPETRIEMLTGWAQEIAPDDPLRALADGVYAKPLPVADLERLLTPR